MSDWDWRTTPAPGSVWTSDWETPNSGLDPQYTVRVTKVEDDGGKVIHYEWHTDDYELAGFGGELWLEDFTDTFRPVDNLFEVTS